MKNDDSLKLKVEAINLMRAIGRIRPLVLAMNAKAVTPEHTAEIEGLLKSVRRSRLAADRVAEQLKANAR